MMHVVASAFLNSNHGGVVPLLFLISVFVDREPRLLKLSKRHSSFLLAWLHVACQQNYGGGAQLLHCVI